MFTKCVFYRINLSLHKIIIMNYVYDNTIYFNFNVFLNHTGFFIKLRYLVIYTDISLLIGKMFKWN